MRFMSLPARAARGPAERVLDEVLAGPLPEAFARSIVEHRVIERFVAELARRGDLEGMTVSALESEQAEQLVKKVLASPALEKMLVYAVESPLPREIASRMLQDPEIQGAIRQIVAQQTMGFAEEAAEAARSRAAEADDRAERLPRRLVGKRPRAGDVPYAGLGSRGIALAVDAVLANLLFVVGAALVQLVASLFGGLRPHWLAGAIGGVAWVLVVVGYFVTFWSGTGRTPGMALMRLRVLDPYQAPPGVLRSLVRFVGLVLAIVPLFAGCLPALVDDRRRALQDFIARTVVVYADDAQPPSARA
jgi:uncharacterized RDD family membrane protein YckC